MTATRRHGCTAEDGHLASLQPDVWSVICDCDAETVLIQPPCHCTTAHQAVHYVAVFVTG